MKDKALAVLRKALKKDNLIERLREVMKERELSAPSVARLIGCTNRQVYRWLAYEASPTLPYRKMIYLGIKRIEKLAWAKGAEDEL